MNIYLKNRNIIYYHAITETHGHFDGNIQMMTSQGSGRGGNISSRYFPTKATAYLFHLHVDATTVLDAQNVGHTRLDRVQPLRAALDVEAVFGRLAYRHQSLIAQLARVKP